MIIGIIGNGFVGNATRLIKSSIIEKIYVYDIVPEKCEPHGLRLEDMSSCDIIFVALPTPMNEDGSCHINLVEKIVGDLKKVINDKTYIVLRSTVPPGTCERLGVYFMPEFLTERSWKTDFINNKVRIFGCKDPNSDFDFKEKIQKIFTVAMLEGIILYDECVFVGTREAELTKYIRNCFLAMKVSFFNEMEEFSRRLGIDYDIVREMVILDERIGSSHTLVPGIDGHRGFGGTCFPKDIHAIVHEMNMIKMNPILLNAVIERNELIDRPEKDWLNDKGRAVTKIN